MANLNSVEQTNKIIVDQETAIIKNNIKYNGHLKCFELSNKVTGEMWSFWKTNYSDTLIDIKNEAINN